MCKNIRIAHFITDEKFVDSAFSQFEQVVPGCSDFFIPSWKRGLKYIKMVPAKFINPGSFKNPSFLADLKQYSFIILHSLNYFNEQLVARADRNVKFVWIGMGTDYYDLIYDDKTYLYLNKTHAKFW